MVVDPGSSEVLARMPAKDNKHEVDFIYDDSMTVLPVEVKYRERMASTDAKGLLEFMRTFDRSTGIIVTMNKFGKEEIDGRNIFFIPIWFFLLVLRLSGHSSHTKQLYTAIII